MKEKLLPFAPAVGTLVLGFSAIAISGSVLKIICYLVAVMLIVFGIGNLISYLVRTAEENAVSNDFALGLIMVVIGALLVIKVDTVSTLVPTLLGILVLFNGVRMLQSVVDVYKLSREKEWVFLALAAINMVFGIILILQPAFLADVLMTVLGVGLIVSSLFDAITILRTGSKLRAAQKPIIEAEAVEE